jgi:catechol 2,3-dioxygenase-like lactoylglutathione lyase family enzyme
MTVQSLDHVNLRVADPAATRSFLIDVLGMGVSPVMPGWITDAAGHPVIHLGGRDSAYPTDIWRPFTGESGTGVVHHVALNCTGYGTMVDRLQARGIDHTANNIASIGLRQIFVDAPGDVMLELNFRE